MGGCVKYSGWRLRPRLCCSLNTHSMPLRSHRLQMGYPSHLTLTLVQFSHVLFIVGGASITCDPMPDVDARLELCCPTLLVSSDPCRCLPLPLLLLLPLLLSMLLLDLPLLLPLRSVELLLFFPMVSPKFHQYFPTLVGIAVFEPGPLLLFSPARPKEAQRGQ